MQTPSKIDARCHSERTGFNKRLCFNEAMGGGAQKVNTLTLTRWSKETAVRCINNQTLTQHLIKREKREERLFSWANVFFSVQKQGFYEIELRLLKLM